MNKYVTDTMALVLFLEKRRMPEKIKDIFQIAETGQMEIIIPAIVLAEIAYLSEKKRIDINLEFIAGYLNNFKNYIEQSLNLDIIKISYGIDDIPELHDRLIAGTAKYLNLDLITNDPIIAHSKHIRTIWK